MHTFDLTRLWGIPLLAGFGLSTIFILGVLFSAPSTDDTDDDEGPSYFFIAVILIIALALAGICLLTGLSAITGRWSQP